MPYLLLILEPHGQRAARTEDEGRALYQRMLDFSEALKARGVLRASQSLRTDAEGVRVAVRDGRRTFLDGVTKEEAVAIAAEVPAAQWATVEVREFGPCFM